MLCSALLCSALLCSAVRESAHAVRASALIPVERQRAYQGGIAAPSKAASINGPCYRNRVHGPPAAFQRHPVQISRVPVHFELNPIAIQRLLMKYSTPHAKYQTFYPQYLRFFDSLGISILCVVLTCVCQPAKHKPLREFAGLFRFRLANLLARMYLISRKALIRCLDTDAVHDRQTESNPNQPMLSRVALANLSRLY